MSADELRRAAETLRSRAEAATGDEWCVVPNASNVWHFPEDGAPTVIVPGNGTQGHHVRQENADYIATLHPGVGLALADWLDQCADRLDKGHHTGSRHSHKIARLINGGA